MFKRIFFICVIVFSFYWLNAQTYQAGEVYTGTNGYISYRAGNLPILISVPHGGLLEPGNIPNRSCNGCVTSNDTNTRDLGIQVQAAIKSLTSCHIHLVVNELHRKKLDANRALSEAALGDVDAELAWNEYHAFMDSAKASITNSWEQGLVIDLHGHGHDIQRLELGYRIDAGQLRMSDSFLDQLSLDDIPIRSLVENGPLLMSEVVRGEQSLGDIFTGKGYDAVPSPSIPFPETGEDYFRGGYITDRYGSKDGTPIDAIQIECHQDVRFDDNERKKFADSLGMAIIEFIGIHYFENLDVMTCSTTSTFQVPNERNIIFPNPACGQIQIPGEFLDAEIRIYNSLGAMFHLTKSSAFVNIAEWPNGMYFIKFDRGTEILSQRIIVQCP